MIFKYNARILHTHLRISCRTRKRTNLVTYLNSIFTNYLREFVPFEQNSFMTNTVQKIHFPWKFNRNTF